MSARNFTADEEYGANPMINFLAPAALFGLALLAIPVVIHLFQPRRVRETPFSSLRWLIQTKQRLARKIKWHQLLLLLIRAAFVIMIVLALARPQFSGNTATATATVERFIVLDTSRSMAYRTAGDKSPFETGQHLAGDIIKRRQAGDRIAVLLTDTRTRILTPLTEDPEFSLLEVERAKAGVAGTDLGSALSVVESMLPQCRKNASIELHIITDNHTGSWSPADVQSFVAAVARPIRVQVLQVGPRSPANAWIADARVRETGENDKTMLTVEVACSGETIQQRDIRISDSSGREDRTLSVELKPGGGKQVTFSISSMANEENKIIKIQLEPPDSLPEDDTFYVDLSSSGRLRVLLIEPATSRIASLRPGFHLKAALAALSQRRHEIDLTIQAPGELTHADILDADIIILADVASLSAFNVAALDTRVKAGAGLAIFLGPQVERQTYNSGMHNPLTPQESLLPLPLLPARDAANGFAALRNVDWTHPLFAGLLDPKLGDIALTRARRFFTFDREALENAFVVGWFDNDAPAVIEHTPGTGRVLIFNTTANDTWSDLPRRSSFVPLVDQILSHLGGGTRTRQFTADEPIAFVATGIREDETVSIEAPNGAHFQPTINTVNGRTVVRVGDVTQTGVFRAIPSQDPVRAVQFIVQPGVTDSIPTPIDTELLASWWGATDFAVVDSAGYNRKPLSDTVHRALWPWLTGLACLLLLVEMYLVHRACPRINPITATMLVRHNN